MVALEKHGELLPAATLESIRRNRIALKSPLTTPVGEGFSSINVELRKRFDLYANVRPAISFPNTKSRYENIDLITVRENTEGAYIGEGAVVSANTTVSKRVEPYTIVAGLSAKPVGQRCRNLNYKVGGRSLFTFLH